MSGKAVTLDEVTDAITVLGTTIGEQFVELRREFKRDLEQAISGLEARLRAELDDLKAAQHRTNQRLSAVEGRLDIVEGEMKAMRNDIREIYDRIVALENRLAQAAPEDYPAIRRDLAKLKAWARQIAAETGLPSPKF